MRHPVWMLVTLFLLFVSLCYLIWVKQLIKRYEAGRGSKLDEVRYSWLKSTNLERSLTLISIILGLSLLLDIVF